MPAQPASSDGEHELQREAANALSRGLAGVQAAAPDARERHRELLARAIELAREAVAAVGDGDGKTVAGARATLVKALAARAEDARHGANQLSLGSQRAPTEAACEDGWRRVEAIVAVAEEAAAEAARLAAGPGDHAARKAAGRAAVAARDARRLVEERNHAYTFHADPRWSFGEGWYVAAAGLLAGVSIQVEPGQPHSSRAERFLRDAGLGARLVPYRPRPRANKPLPEIVARAHRTDPGSAGRALRAAFLGEVPVAPEICAWTERKLAGAPASRKVLLWIRHGAHQPERNTNGPELAELARRVRGAGLVPVLVGDALRSEVPSGAVDLTLFWKEPLFQGEDMRRAQLQLFEELRNAHGLVGQLGVTTAGMDGPALMGLPTMYLTDAPNVRLGTWVGAVPGYEEIVRSEAYLERIAETLRRWADGTPPAGASRRSPSQEPVWP